jgi:hypothetical protein
MIKPFLKEETRQAIAGSLPENDQAASTPAMTVAFTYVPPSHARALDPENTVVEGIRGAGKSFWWAALNSESHRGFVASVFPETRISKSLSTSQGFGTHMSPDQAPSKDTLAQLAKDYDLRHIWRAVVATQIKFSFPFPSGSKWSEKVQWVAEHPENYDELLFKVDEELSKKGKTHLILFDALDRLADDWPHIRPIAKALFQVALDLKGCRSIRLKLFVRPDMIEDREILAFPDSSKLLARRVSLAWRRVDLYALLFQCLGNAPTAGESFRDHCNDAFSLAWDLDVESKAWVLPRTLRSDEEVQKEVFHSITGPTMASGPSGYKRGFPYTWLPNHLLDGRDEVSPRSFCAALRKAAILETPEEWPYTLHYKTIHAGVQEASRIRVNEITREDYPWVNIFMEPLRGQITVPCNAKEILALWKEAGTIDKLRDHTDQTDVVKLPPQHQEQGAEGILIDLQGLGLIQLLSGGRIQMPDVYRIAFGLGRRGGVKPLK